MINHKNIFLILLVIIISTDIAFSQMKGKGLSSSIEDLFKDNLESSLSSDKVLSSDQSAVGDIIEPEYYYLGPGDVLSYINFSESSKQQFLMVTPEMSVYVPRAGEITVKGLTLAEAKISISNKIKEIQSNAIINLSIYKPRKILFSVSGNFIYEGNYSLPASFRISTALSAIENMAKSNEKSIAIQNNLERNAEKNRMMKQQFVGSGIGSNLDYNSRYIIRIRQNGKVDDVDIEKSRVTGDVSLNPYIQENDKIVLPFPDENSSYVSVAGDVNFPVQIPYRRGDKISELILIAGGFTKDADLNNIKVFGENNSIKSLSYDEVNNKFSEETINPGNGVIVGSKQSVQAGIGKNNIAFVSVQGEVKNPGIYQITEGETKIKEVIELAGGFTNEAYLPLAKVIRPNNTMENGKFDDEFLKFFKTSDLTLDDSTRTKSILNFSLPLVSCSLADLYVNNSEEDNVKLKGNDIIRIPKNPKTIYIAGYVKKPGYIEFEQGKNMEWYIERAGGLSSGGKMGRARIIRGNNQIWIEGKSKEFVFAGDQIYVPTNPDYPPGTEFQKYSLIISALFAVGTIAGTIMSVLNYSLQKQAFDRQNSQK